MRINIHCVVEPKCEPYSSYMVLAAQKLARHPEDLQFHLYPTGTGTSSRAHGDGLKAVFEKLDPDHINIIADSDTVLLKKGWDDDVGRLLNGWDCFGVTFADIGQYGAGDGPVQQYKELPVMQWIAMRPNLAWRQFDPRRMDTELPLDTQELADTFHLPLNTRLLRDVSWQLPMFLKQNRMTGLGIKRVVGWDRKVLVGLSEYHEEFWYEGKPFVIHQRGSSKHPFRSEPHSAEFYRRADMHLAKETA